MIVVGGDAAIARDLTTKAAMHDHLLAVAPEPRSHRLHQASALAQTIAGRLAVDMARVETQRAVVPVPPTAQRWSHKRPAMTALELLGTGSPVRRRKAGLATSAPPAM